MGVFDLHVRGLNGASHEEFLHKGSRVANATPLRLFGRTYGELEAAYVASKRQRYAAEAAAAAAKAKGAGKRKRADDAGADVGAGADAGGPSAAATKKAARAKRCAEPPPLPPPSALRARRGRRLRSDRARFRFARL